MAAEPEDFGGFIEPLQKTYNGKKELNVLASEMGVIREIFP